MKPSNALTPPRYALALLALALAVVVLIDARFEQAGLIAALALSATTGVAHGAADAWLLMRFGGRDHTQARPTRAAAVVATLLAYLLVVLLVAGALLWVDNAGLALVLLIALSLWHFGEGYADDRQLPSLQVTALRLARGAAPIAAPTLASFAALSDLLLAALGAQAATALLAFQASLALWAIALLLVLGFLLHARAAGGARGRIAPMQRVLVECAAVLALNVVCSPLMAFALYFGVFHALVHLQRLRKLELSAPESLRSAAQAPSHLLRFTWLATLATLVLLMVLYAALAGGSALAWQALSLQTLIIGLCALTAPHVVLISRLAQRLA